LKRKRSEFESSSAHNEPQIRGLGRCSASSLRARRIAVGTRLINSLGDLPEGDVPLEAKDVDLGIT
jgi:hypothetical protein